MAIPSSDVVIIGGGIVGVSTAYFLAQTGIKSVIVERDSVGSHASGFAYGGLSPLGGAGIPEPMAEVAQEGMRLHLELAYSLSDGWAGHYTTTKPDGLLWTGTTEEEAGSTSPHGEG
jgi:glycine/D-amino acid oxidase-like deaminating enzyme